MPSYGDNDYWEQRYTKEPSAFDWYQGYAGLKHLLHKWLPQSGKILQVGVGTSRIQEDMVKNGYTEIINIDYSKVAISHISQLHANIKGLTYMVMDARSMPDFHSSSFHGVLDKGTLDALLCGEAAIAHVSEMLYECHRVLRPGRSLVLVTYGAPDSRLPYLAQCEWASIMVYIISKVESMDGITEGAQQPVQIKGPFLSPDLEAMEGLCAMQNVHFVYVCKKNGEDDDVTDQ